MREIFRQLFDAVKDGRRVAVVSKYTASDIDRALVFERDHEVWKRFEECGGGIFLSECGGELTMIEYYVPKPRLIILGGGHIALPLCEFGERLGFSVTVFDDRPSFVSEARFPDAETVICDSFNNVGSRLKISENDYVVIVTRGHRHDGLCLRDILSGVFPRYVGMIGSRRRVAIVKKQLEEEMGETEKLERLHAPIGLPIGAVTPEEIALSILSEVVRERRLGAAPEGEALSPDTQLLEWLAGEHEEGLALVTIVSTEGSTPREAGAKMAVTLYGQTAGSIGGGCAEAEVLQKAKDIIRSGSYCLTDIDLADSAEEDGMVCGGTMRVLIETVKGAEIR